MARLIVTESAAEARRLREKLSQGSPQDAERAGVSILNLMIEDWQPGLGGKNLIKLVSRSQEANLKWNRFRDGSPAVLTQFPGDLSDDVWQAVVCRRSMSFIEVACNVVPQGDRFRLDLSTDEITLKRQLAALNEVQNSRGRVGYMRELLLGDKEPIFQKENQRESYQELPTEDSPPGSDSLSDSALNESQKKAVEFALSAEDVAIIHGPPGTGKTTTVVELICQMVANGETVLATAPSNTAIDNLLAKLVERDQKVVRLGHPARVHQDLRSHTIDMLVETDESMKLVKTMRREAEKLFRQAERYTRSRPAAGQKRELRSEAKRLKADARILEKHIVQVVLDRANVICATTTGDLDMLGDRWFDSAIIDEACQSTEPGCWIPVLRSDRLILAGDHLQLPPTVVSDDAAHEGLSLSLLERLVQRFGKSISRQLQMHYRMHDSIAKFSSDYFYESNLIGHDSVKDHLLKDLPHVEESELTSEPIMFVDTAGSGFNEEIEPEGLSKFNEGEARMVAHFVDQLLEAGLRPDEIAVIAPYAAQTRKLKELISNPALEIDTVDGFQGREKEAVVITLVRSNEIGEIGFMADQRRMNVAITRARRKLIVIGDSATLGKSAFFQELLEYFEAEKAYHTVWEYDL